MSLNSVQSFVIENGLNNVCLHPLSRTFTYFSQVVFFKFKICSKINQVVSRSSLSSGNFLLVKFGKKTKFSEFEFEDLVRSCLSILSE